MQIQLYAAVLITIIISRHINIENYGRIGIDFSGKDLDKYCLSQPALFLRFTI